MKPSSLFAAIVFFTQISCAHAKLADEGIYDGKTAQKVDLSSALQSVQPGTVVIASEVHGFEAHHANQVLLLNTLKESGFKVSVGMEFFDFTHQKRIDDFLAAKISEAEFLKAVKWGSIPFDFYRKQVLAPLATHGKTIGINAPRSLTRVISKTGLNSLNDDQRKLLPPDFQIGRDIYRERFTESMLDHVPQDAISRYFEAQSVWDDTMAYISAEFLKNNPEQVLVIIVGDFHAAYGGGLPDRLRARGVNQVFVISQIKQSLTDPESDEIAPHPKWGERANFIWIRH